MNSKTLLLLATGLFLACPPILAHHGDAGRYEDNLTILKGTVIDVQLITPHSIIVVDVPDETGKVMRWQAEMGGRTAMIKDFGWTADTLKPGDKITLTGRKVKSGGPYMNLTDRANVVMTDTGKEIFRTKNYGTEERKRPLAGYRRENAKAFSSSLAVFDSFWCPHSRCCAIAPRSLWCFSFLRWCAASCIHQGLEPRGQ
jgi:hypothetical protein